MARFLEFPLEKLVNFKDDQQTASQLSQYSVDTPTPLFPLQTMDHDIRPGQTALLSI